MSSAQTCEALVRAWVDAFNRADLEALLACYAEDCTHTSPRLRALFPQTGGKLVGREALRGWYADALKRLPGLRYDITAITATQGRAVLEYLRHVPTEPTSPVAEVFEVREGRIVASRVYPG